MRRILILAAALITFTLPSTAALSIKREPQPEKTSGLIKAEVSGRLRFQKGQGYFILINSKENPNLENRVWLWVSENKVLIRRLEGLEDKEVLAKGELEQMPENVRASVPPLGMYLRNFEIAGTEPK
jgi:hypothetical protein